MGATAPKMCCDQSQLKKLPSQLPTLLQYSRQRLITSKYSSQSSQLSGLFQVEKLAKQFCLKNQISEFYVPLLSRIIVYRYENLFQDRWEKLTQSERSQFLENLNDIKFELMDSLYHYFIDDKQREHKLLSKLNNIYSPELFDGEQIQLAQKESLTSIGYDLIKQGKVALVLMCAGSSSRYGSQPKFFTPFYDRLTIMDFLFGNLRKTIQPLTYLPIILSCNSHTLQPIQKYLKQKNYYGLSENCFKFMIATSFVILDPQGKYCMDQQMQFIKRAPGTAETAQQLFSIQIQEYLKAQKIKYIYFSGMENFLEHPCDPLLLGKIYSDNKKIGVKCAISPQFDQHLPRYYSVISKEQKQKIYLLNEYQAKLVSQQQLQKLPVAMNSLVIELKQLQRIVQQQQRKLSLAQNYQVIKKKETIFNYITNSVEEIQCYSFERDIRSYISCSEETVMYLVNQQEEFFPVLTKNKEYSFDNAEIYLKKVAAYNDPQSIIQS